MTTPANRLGPELTARQLFLVEVIATRGPCRRETHATIVADFTDAQEREPTARIREQELLAALGAGWSHGVLYHELNSIRRATNSRLIYWVGGTDGTLVCLNLHLAEFEGLLSDRALALVRLK